ncbi:MAG: tRNA (adenosine(37)-N6)-threonylcarbamoyltransferase complex ATPase subunit type 1 TsaE [Bdellovibrionaceae bacterium]|nr:tRNA (adenosine(37)-N6)-threonylcarbamoyltransferase complex ATPase subunit type 1 TsaE [Pseudobdellovibrionaceae bacterium]|tara:strand:- start:32316 stop:32747 length:432 start_codon:yes stop_codon:yes gene_type:complete
MSTTKTIASLEEMRVWIDQLLQDWGEKHLIVLSGKMGAGKTQLVQLITESLGAKHVMSPTFSIHNSYDSDRVSIDHVDLYRLDGDGDLESTGFWEMFDQDQGWVFVEWGDRLDKSIYPRDWPTTFIHLEKIEGNESARQITIS